MSSKMKKLFSLLLAVALSVSFFAFYPSADNSVSVGEDRISDVSRREYVNAMLAYHLSENGEKLLSDALQNGKSAIFFFEGASNNTLRGSIYSNYEKYRFACVCIVVKLVDGKPEIVFFDDFSSTIPDHPRDAYSHNEAIATLVDGVYPVINCNHYTYAALHVPAYDWGTAIRCSQTEYYTDTCYGINIHNRGSNMLYPGSQNSLGCLIVGKCAANSESYNDFMYAVTGIKNAFSSVFDEVSIDCGCVIIDRALYKNELLKIYDSGKGDKLSVVNQITAYTNKINSFARKYIPTDESGSGSQGDFNGDGKINTADAIYLLRNMMRPSKYPVNQSSDFNGDGKANSADAVYLLRWILRH